MASAARDVLLKRPPDYHNKERVIFLLSGLDVEKTQSIELLTAPSLLDMVVQPLNHYSLAVLGRVGRPGAVLAAGATHVDWSRRFQRRVES